MTLGFIAKICVVIEEQIMIFDVEIQQIYNFSFFRIACRFFLRATLHMFKINH